MRREVLRDGPPLTLRLGSSTCSLHDLAGWTGVLADCVVTRMPALAWAIVHVGARTPLAVPHVRIAASRSSDAQRLQSYFQPRDPWATWRFADNSAGPVGRRDISGPFAPMLAPDTRTHGRTYTRTHTHTHSFPKNQPPRHKIYVRAARRVKTPRAREALEEQRILTG